jgi:hypothetical protein
MDPDDGKTADDTTTTTKPKIDRTAPAGSENSLGAKSVRDGRPATDDSVIEAIDEAGPNLGVAPAQRSR